MIRVDVAHQATLQRRRRLAVATDVVLCIRLWGVRNGIARKLRAARLLRGAFSGSLEPTDVVSGHLGARQRLLCGS